MNKALINDHVKRTIILKTDLHTTNWLIKDKKTIGQLFNEKRKKRDYYANLNERDFVNNK